MAMFSALAAHNLVKSYQCARSLLAPWRVKRHRALNGLCLTVEPGERVALIGPNGAGKTTLARIACGSLLPDAGLVEVGGKPIGHGHRWRAAVGFAKPDDPALHPRLSALEALRFYAVLYGKNLGPLELEKLLDRVGGASLARQRIQTMSGGEKAKVSLAKALLHEPLLIILDEISRVLDPSAATRIRELLRERAQTGAAVLFITHDLAEATLCDRVAVVSYGRLLAYGPWNEVASYAREVFSL